MIATHTETDSLTVSASVASAVIGSGVTLGGGRSSQWSSEVPVLAIGNIRCIQLLSRAAQNSAALQIAHTRKEHELLHDSTPLLSYDVLLHRQRWPGGACSLGNEYLITIRYCDP